MQYSLLAHLYPYIKGSQEDIATFSLQYLLIQSRELNKAFTRRIACAMEIELEETLEYICQVTGDSADKERPDMSGMNKNNKETVLFEMKFYASLTPNQPLTYLNRLKNNNGKGLVFIAPVNRRTSLWANLKELCSNELTEKVNDYCIKVNGINLAIITWTEIIELMKNTASSMDIAYLPDIIQLEGYCNQIDSDAFVPFLSRDLEGGTAKKIDRYYQVVDEIMNLFDADSDIQTNKKGTKASAYRYGYTRSILFDNYSLTITLNYDRKLWENPRSQETPFWVSIRDKNWNQSQAIVDKLVENIPEYKREKFWGVVFIALEPLQNATLQEVAENLKDQILKYITLVLS